MAKIKIGKLLDKSITRGKKVTRSQVVYDTGVSAQVRQNFGSRSTDYLTTMTTSPKPAAQKRWLASLP